MPYFTAHVKQSRPTAFRAVTYCFEATSRRAAQKEARRRATKDKRSKWVKTRVVMCVQGVNKGWKPYNNIVLE